MVSSEEAFERIIKSHCIAMVCLGIDKPDIETEKAIKIIEKELKVLEILKKKMVINTDYYDSDFGCEEFEYISYNGQPLNIENKEEYDLIKEWLENDERI